MIPKASAVPLAAVAARAAPLAVIAARPVRRPFVADRLGCVLPVALALLAAACGSGAGSQRGPGAPLEPGSLSSTGAATPAPSSGPGGVASPAVSGMVSPVASPAASGMVSPSPVQRPVSPPAATGAVSSAGPGLVALPSGPGGDRSVPQMKAPVPTALAPRLQALGLDPQNLPAIEKLEPRTLRGAMRLMAESLGVKCGDCHEENDFAAPTRRKKIAVHMWDDFVAKLALADGSTLFCDSCHQGRVEQLDRRDAQVLSSWMDANFVAKLARKDGQPQTCETCHVDMNMRLLSDWGR